jgi:DNA-binding response OmpR family regulator
MRILVVEDDEGVAAAIVDALVTRGHGVVRTALAAEAATLHREVDMMLLDLNLPDGNGLELLRTLRRSSDLPVLVLTARASERDIVRGLRLGADDYLVKPVRLAELLARIDAVARRIPARTGDPTVVDVGDVRVELGARRVTVAAEERALTGKEFDILAVLARNAGVAVSRQQLLDEVWGDATVATSRTLDVHLTALRGKIDRPDLFTTVRNFGYRFG